MDRIGIAVVDSGDMGGVYAESVVNHTSGGRLVAIHGGRRAAGLAADYRVDHVARYDDLLARGDVQAVVLAVPHSLHEEMTVAAARAGKQILVEKPMARDTAECDAMIGAADAAGVHLSVILTMRFDEHFIAAKRLIDGGAIGTVRMIRLSGLTPGYDMGHKTWLADPAEGGAILDWGSHGFDILRHVAGADPVHLSAEMTRFDPGTMVDDATAMVQLAYANGVRAQLWMSYELPPPGLDTAFKIWIVGSEGIIEVQRFGPCRLGKGAGWTNVTEGGTADWALERRKDPVRIPAPALQIQDFIDSVREGRSSSAPADAGRWAIMQVEAAYRSARSGQTVRLPLTS